MAVAGIVDLVTALSEQRFVDVEGTPEAEWVDFKLGPYATDPQHPLRLTERGRWELCKDVAAFANGRDGCIVVGFPEVSDPTRGVKVAGPLVPIPVAAVDLDHYRDVLERGVYPVPQGVELHWFPVAASQPPAGALVIHMPEATDRPLILRKLVTEQGDSIQAVAIPVRNADRANWYTPERVHHLLRQAERLSIAAVPAATDEAIWTRADEAISYLIRLEDWDESAMLFLQAVPAGGPGRLPDFYDVVKERLERPNSVRPSGFNLRSLGGAADVIGGALVVRRMEDAAARVEPNGLMTVGVLADRQFLGWSLNQSSAGTDMKVNSTTLIELTLEFCRFVHEVLLPRGATAHWTYRISCRALQTHHVMLAPGPASKSMARWDWTEATADDWVEQVDAGAESTRDAFEIAAAIYALFGLPESAIPYSADRAISIEQIRALDQSRS